MRAVRRSCARVSIKSRKRPPRPPARRRRRPARRPRPNAIYKGRPALGGRNRLTETQEKGHTWRIIMCELFDEYRLALFRSLRIRLEPALATFNYALTDISGLVSFSDCDWLRIEKIMTMMGYWNISSIKFLRALKMRAVRRSCARVSIKSRKSPPRPPAPTSPRARPRPNAIYKDGRHSAVGIDSTETQEKGHTWRIIIFWLKGSTNTGWLCFDHSESRLEPALATFNYALTDISGLVSFSDCDWLRIENNDDDGLLEYKLNKYAFKI
ncbi:hypothetical protein EVAR_95831_1 [Eumeta japonica]|uniref:Uncharacterized protein n=1 Tax=Eumeta variegata TaxID=151549 RepID=A0A4C1VLI1_EUMVA|nr:hypothetical protein EVAR_95831_1 [Eumeta japonica]